MTDKRPILMGMNNPLSSVDDHALYPYPPGCTGARLFGMLRAARPETTEDEYLEDFDRRNLIVGVWNKDRAKIAANQVCQELMGSERTLVLLGKDVQGAFNVKLEPLSFERSRGGFWVRTIPHPSGLNRWYAVPGNSEAVGQILAGLLCGHR